MQVALAENPEYMSRARALIAAMEAGDDEGVAHLIDELTTLRETRLFQQIGQLTRELHESVKTFCDDAQVSKLAHRDIPDARERLNYVITLTKQAADKTLSAVEKGVPLTKEIGDRAAALEARWNSFRDRRMALPEFRDLSVELGDFFQFTRGGAEQVNQGLSDVLMAQEFQDLTGQIIQRVIQLVEEVEEKLVSIISLSGGRLVEENKLEGGINAEGPVIPSAQRQDVVNGQDEVDDLLASLGF